jgi:hypothetical protein
MVGGLALSQPLTLYTTPVVYLFLDRLRGRRLETTSEHEISKAIAAEYLRASVSSGSILMLHLISAPALRVPLPHWRSLDRKSGFS